MREFERIELYNVTNGERFDTYIIKAARGSGAISLNGAAARRAQVGDLMIICTYGPMSEEDSATHKPKVAGGRRQPRQGNPQVPGLRPGRARAMARPVNPILFHAMSFQVIIQPSKHQFPVEPGQTVLDAALAACIVLQLPQRRLLHLQRQGGVRGVRRRPVPRADPVARRTGRRLLLCQARPESDLVVESTEVRLASDIQIRKLPSRVQTMERAAPDVAVLAAVACLRAVPLLRGPVRRGHPEGRPPPQLFHGRRAALAARWNCTSATCPAACSPTTCSGLAPRR